MRALITGVAGFAGVYLAELLAAKGIETYGVSLEKEFKPFLPIEPSAVRYSALDICDRPRVLELLNDIHPDLIFHLAAITSPRQSIQDPESSYEVNLGGTLAVLEAIRVHKIRCRFLLVSSSHVYGNAISRRPISEDAPLRPETPYAASKVAGEMAAYQYWESYRIETVRVRAFNHTGPGQKPGFVCPDLARKVVEIERGLRPPRLEVANPGHVIDFSDVRDVVRGYYSALTQGVAGEVYNLCSGTGLLVREIAENLIARAQTVSELVTVGLGVTPEKDRTLVGDCTHASRGLGWNPSIPFHQTLNDVLDYWRRELREPSSHTRPRVSGNKMTVSLI
jgi:GDP-4-dehydro-6-deoxy-D-mannose reductase